MSNIEMARLSGRQRARNQRDKIQSAGILAENSGGATREERFEQILGIKTETAMSRRKADLIAVLIFTYDSTPLLIHSGGTAVRDESLGRVPHHLFVAEQIQIIQHFRAEGSTFAHVKRRTVGCLLMFSIRTDRIVRDGQRVNHDIHSLFHRQSL
jgi:hypothetical protein